VTDNESRPAVVYVHGGKDRDAAVPLFTFSD
jgi:hypothetical protein